MQREKEKIDEIRLDVDKKINQTALIWGLTSTQMYIVAIVAVLLCAIGIKFVF